LLFYKNWDILIYIILFSLVYIIYSLFFLIWTIQLCLVLAISYASLRWICIWFVEMQAATTYFATSVAPHFYQLVPEASGSIPRRGGFHLITLLNDNHHFGRIPQPRLTLQCVNCNRLHWPAPPSFVTSNYKSELLLCLMQITAIRITKSTQFRLRIYIDIHNRHIIKKYIHISNTK